MKWYIVLFLAIVLEAVVAYLKTIVVDRKIQWQTVLAILLGVTAALVYKIDLFVLSEATTLQTILGEILSGILISRGSDYIVAFIELIDNGAATIAKRE
ncbi:MAG: hypothetical protein VB092_09980 [Oscillospiraceae bacterium]|nr:hypothetical protein [Oscillospiraceae bacterium]